MATILMATLAQAKPKNIVVIGGVMKSHQLAMVPIIEGLLERGHNVTFVLPNSNEAHQWFPEGLGKARLLHLGPEDATFEAFKIPDMKNLQWHQKITGWIHILWNYRSLLDKPFFGMVEDFEVLLKQQNFDVAFTFAMAFGCNQILAKSQIPWIGFLSVPPHPEFVIQDTDLLCNYPNMANPRSLRELQRSLRVRVQNRIECKLLHAYTLFATWTVNSILRERGFRGVQHFSQLLLQAPLTIMLGGPPLSLPVRLPSKVQVVGTIELAKPRALPVEMAEWLAAASKANAAVAYVSMGTKYELTMSSGQNLLRMLQRLQSSGLRILWSLRPQQQELLREVLPKPSSLMRIEAFTPQPEVLAHPAVKMFLSHCGWGGITDTLSAGVPTLAYPSFSDQRGNAQRLCEAGAALMVDPDFGNLPEAAGRILEEPSFASQAQLLGGALRRLGGLNRTLQLVEAAAEGRYLEPLPEVRQAVDQVDPFLHRTHETEMVLSTAFACLCFLLGLCTFTCCCRCCLWLCCPWLSKPVKKKVKRSKKNQ
eukprot:symbB.v1.2.023601.t1/scaffold2170.1/size90759/5